MNKNSAIIASFVLILLILSTSGCMDYFNISEGSVIYESHPTKIQYNLRYGYWINCSGAGEYDIHYDCNLPEVLHGSISQQQILYKQDYETVPLANNTVLQWNIKGKDKHNYELGASATVESESFLVSDLNGENAFSIQEINTIYPNLISQYCQEQSNKTITFIDPNYPSIKNTATNVSNQANSGNSFVLAKELFIWLKQNTIYLMHTDNNSVQPAGTTYQLKTGDCDDLSFLYISLCRSLGIPARFIRGYLLKEKNGVPTAGPHAWAEVFVGGGIGNSGWIPVECACNASIQTEVHQNFGVEDATHLRLFVDDGSNESMEATISELTIYCDPTKMNIHRTSFVEIYNYSVLESKELTVDKNGNRAYE